MPLTQAAAFKDGSIVDADISSSTVISASKLDVSGATPSLNNAVITGTSAEIADGVVISKPLFQNTTYDNTFQDSSVELGHALTFSSDGSKMYMVDTFQDRVIQLNLATPWSFSAANTTEYIFSVGTQDTAPAGISFSPDGLNFYMVGDFTNDIYRYKLTTPWDLATASYDSSAPLVADSSWGLAFKPDGKRFYTINNAGNTVKEFILTTAWDITTLSAGNILAITGGARDLHFTSDGRYMLFVYSSSFYYYRLNTNWDLSGGVTSVQKNIAQITNGYGIYIRPNCENLYILDSTSDRVFKFNIPSVLNSNIAAYGDVDLTGSVSCGSDLSVQGKINDAKLYGNTYIDGPVTANGTITIRKAVEAAKPGLGFVDTLTVTSGTVTIDTSLGNVIYGKLDGPVTTWAFTNVPFAKSIVTTITVILTGTTANTYGNSSTVNGALATIRWKDATIPTPSNNNTDILTFVIATDNTNTQRVFGSASTNHS